MPHRIFRAAIGFNYWVTEGALESAFVLLYAIFRG